MIRKTVLIATGIAIGAGCATLGQQARAVIGAPAQAASADTYKNLSLFGDVFDKVRADYVEKPDEQKLVESGYTILKLSPEEQEAMASKVRAEIWPMLEDSVGKANIERLLSSLK